MTGDVTTSINLLLFEDKEVSPVHLPPVTSFHYLEYPSRSASGGRDLPPQTHTHIHTPCTSSSSRARCSYWDRVPWSTQRALITDLKFLFELNADRSKKKRKRRRKVCFLLRDRLGYVQRGNREPARIINPGQRGRYFLHETERRRQVTLKRP